ncbi:hypothetical protein [Streptomyces sp. NPDC002779]|uniref:hypothetical protein n=1 Tax=Streptomyces sp. NPDC002779 TaxID=3364664 RepID=UPI003675237F
MAAEFVNVTFTAGASRTVLDLGGHQYQASTQAELFERMPEFEDVHQAWEKLLRNVGVYAIRQQLADGDLASAKEHWNRLLEMCEDWSFRRLLTDPQTCTMTPQQVETLRRHGLWHRWLGRVLRHGSPRDPPDHDQRHGTRPTADPRRRERARTAVLDHSGATA